MQDPAPKLVVCTCRRLGVYISYNRPARFELIRLDILWDVYERQAAKLRHREESSTGLSAAFESRRVLSLESFTHALIGVGPGCGPDASVNVDKYTQG